jgi:hypothetical protein
MSDFSGKSAKTRRFSRPRRLTARLPDVGTVTALPSGLIRAWAPAVLKDADRLSGRLQGAVIAYQSGKPNYNVAGLAGNVAGAAGNGKRIDPDGAFETSGGNA